MEAEEGHFHDIRKESYIMETEEEMFHDIRKKSYIMETEAVLLSTQRFSLLL